MIFIMSNPAECTIPPSATHEQAIPPAQSAAETTASLEAQKTVEDQLNIGLPFNCPHCQAAFLLKISDDEKRRQFASSIITEKIQAKFMTHRACPGSQGSQGQEPFVRIIYCRSNGEITISTINQDETSCAILALQRLAQQEDTEPNIASLQADLKALIQTITALFEPQTSPPANADDQAKASAAAVERGLSLLKQHLSVIMEAFASKDLADISFIDALGLSTGRDEVERAVLQSIIDEIMQDRAQKLLTNIRSGQAVGYNKMILKGLIRKGLNLNLTPEDEALLA